MAEALDAGLLREFGAVKIKFRTVRGAMLWLSDERQRRTRLEQPYESGSTPRSVQSRDLRNATYAALVNCMNPQKLPYVQILPEWHMGWRSRREMAKEQGWSEYALQRTMKQTENKLRAMLEDAGLLQSQTIKP